MYYSAIGFLAILILFIVNRDILFHRISFEKKAWTIYKRFLFAVLVYYIVDALWGILEEQKLAALLFADTTVYFLAMSAGILYWAEYTMAYLEKEDTFGRAMLYAGRVIAALITVLTIVNIFAPVLFTVDSESVYTALPARYVTLTGQILLLLLISVYALLSMRGPDRAAEMRQRYLILASFGLIMAVFLFCQLWFPYLPLYSIAYMLGTSLLHSFVANDEKEEHRRELAEAEKITELKETITSLLDNMPGMTFTKDASTGVYLACNQAFAEYAHKENPSGVAGLTDTQIFDAQTAAHFAEDDRIALSISKPYVFFEDVPDAAGNQRQLQTTKLKYTDSSGRLCVLGMCQDVTDMVRIQHENAMTKEAYENAVSSGLMYTHIAHTLARDYADMFYVNIDTEEFVEYCREGENRALSEKRRGWHFFSDGVAGLAETIYPDDREAFRRAMTRKTLMKALDQKDTFVITCRQIRDSGSFYVSLKVSRMEDDNHFIILGITDIDEEMRDTMAKNEALAEALAAAEQANKARSSLLSAMNHEIRTPMNTIIGLDTLALKKDSLDPDTRESLEKIGDSARHLLSLISDILDMSRIESGHTALNREEFSLGALLEQINTRTAAACFEKGLSFECRFLNRMDDAYIGDEGKLKTILTNILSNAVRFTEQGGIILTAEQTETFGDQATLCFRVRDTGIGMDADYLPKVFDAFSREDSSRRTRLGGTGLGMAITKRIVDSMNGTIAVESEKGAGTVFTVTVTLTTCGSTETNRDITVDFRSLCALVVDHNPVDAEHAAAVLEQAGIRADTCAGGREALALLEARRIERRPYNLVLVNWHMPDMSGAETAAEIRKLYGDECAVVALTSSNWDEIREEAAGAGVNSYLPKPLLAENLREKLERFARRDGMAALREKKRANLAGRRILLAEDLESNTEIMMDMLELENIRTDHAPNGRIAVEMFTGSEPGTYAAILMDVRMPEMDGPEAAAAIRAMPREDAKRVPIVALTASAFEEDVQRSLQAGMNAHLSMPVDSDRLIRLLGELVRSAEEQ